MLVDNSVSKVVDENGEPLVVYHGTNKKFTEFKQEKETNSSWFTSDKNYAMYYAKMAKQSDNNSGNELIYQVFLNIKNPYDIRFKVEGNKMITTNGKVLPLAASMDFELDYNKVAELLYFNQIKDNDGVFGQDKIYGNMEKSVGTEYVVFNPNQIKSATDNVGTFSKENNDIRHSSIRETYSPSTIAFVDKFPISQQVTMVEKLDNGELNIRCK